MRTAEPDLELIERIYAASLDDTLFPDLVDQIRRHFRSDGGFCLLHDPTAVAGSMAVVAGFSPEIMQRYQELSPHNLRIQAATSRMRVGSVASGTDFVDDREFKRTVFYDEFVRPLGVLPDLGTLIEQNDTSSAMLLVIRDPRRGAYSDGERRMMGVVSRHLKRAMHVRRRLQTAERSRSIERLALEQLGLAFLLLDRGGRVVFANSSADALLGRARVLRVRGTVLESVDPRDRVEFTSMLRDALLASAGVTELSVKSHLNLHSGQDHPSHIATFCPIRLPATAIGGPTAVVAVFVQETSVGRTTHLSPAELRRTFGLSQTEARLAMLLARGVGLCDAAVELGQKVNTTRTVLKSVFAKTGTHRQAELVALMLRCEAN